MATKLNEDKLIVSKANSLVELKLTDKTDLSDEQPETNPLIELKRYKLGFEEFKLMSIYCAKINPLDTNTRRVTFPVQEFLDVIGYDGPERTMLPFLKKKTLNLLHNLVQINHPDLGYTQIVLFTFCNVSRSKETGEWVITLNTSEDALPLFFKLKSNFTSYKLKNILYLKSLNQLRMYELIKEHQFKDFFIINLSDLREFLGIKPEKHARWADFQRYVLKPCQRALKEHTDVSFEYKITGKIGKKVDVLRFDISDNSPMLEQGEQAERSEQSEQTERPEQPDLPLLQDESTTLKVKTIPVPATKCQKNNYANHPLREYALAVTHVSDNVISEESYTAGILKKWDDAGHTCLEDLMRAGVLSKYPAQKQQTGYTPIEADIKPSFDIKKW